MKIGEKLQKLRKAKGLTQEDLADYLAVSRQSVSKWELDLAYPETEKLIKLSQLYEVTIDSLINPQKEMNYQTKRYHYEYKSKRTLFGLPLVHINIGKGKYISKGILSIGNIATGFLSLGFFSFGFFSFGLLGIGLFSLAVLSIALLLAVGSIAIGIIAVGAIALGLFTIGAISIGYFSVGALSIGKYIAFGDYANGLIAIGKTKAEGTYHFLEPINKQEVINTIEKVVPSKWSIFIEWIKFFISF
jgi:transcriptional regulator with XRE-family HTH domain